MTQRIYMYDTDTFAENIIRETNFNCCGIRVRLKKKKHTTCRSFKYNLNKNVNI